MFTLHNVFTRCYREEMFAYRCVCVGRPFRTAVAVMRHDWPRSSEAIYHFLDDWYVCLLALECEEAPSLSYEGSCDMCDMGDVTVCNVTLWCVWLPTILRLPCFVIWAHLALCYINRYSRAGQMPAFAFIFQSGSTRLCGGWEQFNYKAHYTFIPSGFFWGLQSSCFVK